ncbi:MAG: hypothetical protein LBI90_05870, partial [Treponema sp.]|nr:hypothetical protein [Treponema sp.]
NGIEQPGKTRAGNGETAGENLAAVSLRGEAGPVPAALAADQDTGMKGASLFLAAFALLAAASVFFMVRMRMQIKKTKDDTEGRVT